MLRLADPRLGEDALEAVRQVLESGHLTQGPMVERFEAGVAEFTGARHAVATTSATTAIELALAALGIGPGDEVLAADFTYPATGNAVLQRGATLRLVDADPDTFCIDPEALAAMLTERTRAVLTVDVFGLPADYARIEPLLAERGVPLVCDAACSLGGAVGGRRVGTFGTLSCFSFHPRKSLTTGEGGMVTTDDPGLDERMRMLRNHGTRREGWRASFHEPGFNYRMSDINAALGVVQVPHHEETVRRRGELAAKLTAALPAGARAQSVPDGHLHPYQAYVVVLDSGIDRDAVIADLREAGVESTLGTYAMHREPAFIEACGEQTLPGSAMLAERTLALPLHQRLQDSDVPLIAEALYQATVRRMPSSSPTAGT